MAKEKIIYEAGVNLNGAINDLEKLSVKFRDNRILTEKLRAEAAKYKKELKELAKSEEAQTTEGKKRYAALIDKINDTEQSLRQARKTQRELNKEYDKLNLPTNSMARLRAETNAMQKTLDKHVRGVTIATDKYDELKDTVEANRLAIINYDQSINDGRTNVGRYTQSLEGIKSKFDQILGVSVGLGGAISGIFALDSAISAIGDFNEKIRETAVEQRAVNISFEGTKSQLQNYRAEIKGVANTLETDFNETLNAANQLTSRFGTDTDKAIRLITRGLDNVRDKGGFLGLVNEELRKFVDLGVDDESAIALLTQASNLGINPDVFAEPLIKKLHLQQLMHLKPHLVKRKLLRYLKPLRNLQ
jgi:DNA repair exonuclease SbcCD ATPase subunit